MLEAQCIRNVCFDYPGKCAVWIGCSLHISVDVTLLLVLLRSQFSLAIEVLTLFIPVKHVKLNKMYFTGHSMAISVGNVQPLNLSLG